MGRKRLLTILAGAVAAVGLHLGPAAALDLEADLGDTTVSVKADLFDGVSAAIVKECEDEKTAKLIEQCIEDQEASLSVSKDDGVKAKAGDTEVSTKDTTKKVTEPVEKATSGGDDSSSTTKERSSSGGSDDGGQRSSSTGGSSSDVSTAGGARSAGAPSERPDALSPEEARQFLASSRESIDLSGTGGDVTPAFGFSSGGFGGDLDDPLVASPGAVPADEGTSEGEWHAASPETAPSRSDAELAAIPTSGSDVPAGLKLIAALLVAGTGTLWHLTRRELSPVKA